MPLFGRSKPKLNAARVERVMRAAAQQNPSQSELRRNKRNLQRTETWQRCILVGDMGQRLDGILLDYSQSGGRVRFRTHQSLPQSFTLSVPTLGINHRVRTVWQSHGDAGLAFV